MQPTTAQPDVITGWTLSVAPQHPPKPECSEFSWVVTPPYHFQNQRYLDTSYSTTAQEAMRNSPRSFKFVLNCADYHTEDERVEEVLSPGNHSKEEVDDALAKLGSSPVGEGNLWVEDYRIIPGKRDAAGVDLGRIYWIRFKVEIEYPRAAESRQPE
ncbi:MAG TPA: hypothetical protein VL523_18975 [Terriglobia bacterium]|nr:hypothetical protein [Terriglobia bacterium]